MLKLGLGLGLTRSSLLGGPVAGGFSAEVDAVLDAIGDVPSELETAYEALIDGIKADGDWTNLDTLKVYRTFSIGAAAVNLRNPGTFDSTFVNIDSEEDFNPIVGIVTDGTTSYIDTNFNPATGGSNYTQNSACFRVYYSAACVADQISAGWTPPIAIRPRAATGQNNFAGRINQTSGSTTSGAIAGDGLFTAARSSSSVTRFSRNGSALTISTNPNQTSVAPENATICLGRSTLSIYVAGSFSAELISGFQTLAADGRIKTRIDTFTTAINAWAS